jgi:hypothetical protein
MLFIVIPSAPLTHCAACLVAFCGSRLFLSLFWMCVHSGERNCYNFQRFQQQKAVRTILGRPRGLN